MHGLDDESPMGTNGLSDDTITRLSNLGTQTQGRQKVT